MSLSLKLRLAHTRRLAAVATVTLLISACANIKKIIPVDQFRPADLEPRVSFVDKNVVEVEPSQIKGIPAEQVIRSYERLLQRGNPEIRKEALHRLADLTMRLAEAKQVAIDSESSTSITPAMQQSSFNKAIQLYKALLNEFPAYQYSDEVKYQLARAYSLNSEPESSLGILDQIAVTHVQSNSYVESQFRRGESYFVRKKYRVAEEAYSQVILKGVNTEFYDKALYKRGWSLFKQSLFLEAQNDFFKLYERLLYQQELSGQSNKLTKDLIIDTQRVISLAFYNMDGAESINAYFKQVGKQKYEAEIYAGLAELYIEQERFQDAADTYLGYIEGNPLSLSAPEFHTRVIEIYRKGGFPSLILPAKESFVVKYGRTSPFWQKYEGKVIEDLLPHLRTHLDDISKYYHAQAQASKKPADYLVAAKWYREILATFNEQATDSHYRFLLAETLNDGGDLLGSAKEYEIVAYKNEKSKYSRDAGYRALVGYQNITHPSNATQQEKLLPSILSGQKFSQAFPNDVKAPEILSRVAEQQLSLNDVQGAIDSSNQLLLLPVKPTKTQAERARVIIANGLFDLKRYAEAEVAITDLLQNVKLSSTQRKEFRQRRVESVYKLAEKAREEKKLDESVTLFLKVKSLEPKLPIAKNAHYDAATLLLQLENWSRAGSLLESFRKLYPKDKLSETIPERLALVYEKRQDWNKAAKEYLTLANNQADPELAREGHWQVADLYMKANNKNQAIASFKNYVWNYPKPYLLAQEGRAKLIQLYIDTGDATKSMFWRQKVVEFYAKNKSENNSRTSFLAAESKFILSEPLYNQFKNIKLKLPLAKSLKRKRAAMKKALDAYNLIAKYNVAKFTTASTHKVALIYHTLSKDLMDSQRPKGLSEDELEEYTYLLEDQALPFEDKAIGFYEVNALRTANKIYDDSVKSSINELRKLKPAQYDKSERLEELSSVQF
ncbi:MAG: tetratricopeptide repeat protein [Kangiellaceae bacterium]|nr:tetratricopeptide repeat protein [Kangiellaceae bacterium]